MERAARAAEWSEPPPTDAYVPAPRIRPQTPDERTTAMDFAHSLDSAVAREESGPLGLWLPDNFFHVFLPPNAEAHAVAWRTQPGRRAKIVEPVPISGLGAIGAWRATLLPVPDAADHPAPVTGFAVVDGTGLRARYEFVWRRSVAGWQADDPAGAGDEGNIAGSGRASGAVNRISSVVRGTWTASCGRCQRYLLGNHPGAPKFALCRRDCLSKISAF
jgi:hypothetical protein